MQLNIAFVPKDIRFVPNEEAMANARAHMKTDRWEIYVGYVTTFRPKKVMFLDEGDNSIMTIRCPACHAGLAPEREHYEWTQALREQLHAGQQAIDFEKHKIAMPCCKNAVTVIDLDFGGHAGFAQFGFELEDPCFDNLEQADELLNELAEIVGCALVKIEFWST